jgi:hypothetical protein
MTRDEAIAEAQAAAWHAKDLADDAKRAARSSDPNRRASGQQFAQASIAWANSSRAYSALAAVLPETIPGGIDA